MNIPFNKPLVLGTEQIYVNELISSSDKFSGDGRFTKACHQKIEELTGASKVLLTTSCTHALEMAAMLIDVQPGDEVIMSSFTFVSSANPFVLRGATIVFVDIDPATMNIDADLIEDAITPSTKAIVPMHYGSVACDMKKINELADKYGLWIIEDAAQCIDSYYDQKHLGTLGHLGTISFHDTKNIHCGEGGCLLLNDERLMERSEIIREKGTNRSKFLRGEVDKYSWVEAGSSYLPSELNAAFLLAQLEALSQITQKRKQFWQEYYLAFSQIGVEMQDVPAYAKTNGHLFYIKCSDIDHRQNIIDQLQKDSIGSAFHYIPLHSSNAGLSFGRFHGEDRLTTKESRRLLRLP
ncbi:MAG: dTDP-4-amino-4,6-dideoxygalactose transaminase, partial [Ekhidna sp.]|nr:dTDP-4-amino-4,6-dideoxygalactose transaminase [Ekhidna sp.]